MKNTIYKIGLLLFAFALVSSCESPEAETNYTPAEYEFPAGISLNTSNITNASFQFTYAIVGGGQGYYVVVESGSPAPDSNDVFNGSAAGLVKSGSFDLDGATVSVDVTDDLCDNSGYDVYAVHFTSDSFLSEDVESISVTTTENASIAGTYDTVTNGFSAWYGEDVVDLEGVVTITDNGDGTFTFDDFTAGYYTEYFGHYGAGAVEATFTVPCNSIAGFRVTPFYNCCEDYLNFKGTINFDGSISVHWESNFFGEVVDVIYTKQ